MIEKSEFIENYTGILDPNIAYAKAKAQAEVDSGLFKNATYSPAYNKQLEREHIRTAMIRAGARC